MAVDMAEIVRRRFSTDAKVSDIEKSTKESEIKEGDKKRVSSIEITLMK